MQKKGGGVIGEREKRNEFPMNDAFLAMRESGHVADRERCATRREGEKRVDQLEN